MKSWNNIVTVNSVCEAYFENTVRTASEFAADAFAGKCTTLKTRVCVGMFVWMCVCSSSNVRKIRSLLLQVSLLLLLLLFECETWVQLAMTIGDSLNCIINECFGHCVCVWNASAAASTAAAAVDCARVISACLFVCVCVCESKCVCVFMWASLVEWTKVTQKLINKCSKYIYCLKTKKSRSIAWICNCCCCSHCCYLFIFCLCARATRVNYCWSTMCGPSNLLPFYIWVCVRTCVCVLIVYLGNAKRLTYILIPLLSNSCHACARQREKQQERELLLFLCALTRTHACAQHAVYCIVFVLYFCIQWQMSISIWILYFVERINAYVT